MNSANKLSLFICCIVTTHSTHAFIRDNHHFYKASQLSGEPRLEKKLLGSIDVACAGGKTRSSRPTMYPKKQLIKNCCYEDDSLLSIYGPHVMTYLGKGVPCKNVCTAADIALEQLQLLPTRDSFGILQFTGKFSFFSAQFSYTQNYSHGFFSYLHMPLYHMRLSDICYQDLSPENSPFPNKKTVEWTTFLQLFDTILNRYELRLEGPDNTHIGDTTVLIGWTNNYEDTDVLDYIDTTLTVGVLVPTGRKQNINKAFDIAYGYNGHLGIPFSAACSFGAFDWLTTGAHFESILFLNKDRTVRMKTAPEQSGFIKLAQGTATVEQGTLWSAGAHLKADHVMQGFSCLVGYAFATQRKSTLTPCDCSIFTPNIVNHDAQFQGWKMHTLHFWFEYDFTQDENKIGTKIALFYDKQIGGQRVFKTDILGGAIGIDFTARF